MVEPLKLHSFILNLILNQYGLKNQIRKLIQSY